MPQAGYTANRNRLHTKTQALAVDKSNRGRDWPFSMHMSFDWMPMTAITRALAECVRSRRSLEHANIDILGPL